MSFALLQYWILFFLCVQLLIEISNLSIIKSFSHPISSQKRPFVSILVPARDEEKNIAKCVSSLLKQEYPQYELLVLDDHSKDQTLEILKSIKEKEKKREFHILKGKPLRDGWYGKHWACHQLAQKARGEILLFVDADTEHQPLMLQRSVALLLDSDLDLLSAIIYQRMETWGERITVPYPVWSIFSLLPIWIGVVFKIPAFSAANGQFMMFKKKSYHEIGGHESVKNNAVDDVALGRLVLKRKMNWRIHEGVEYVSCRMYHSFQDAYQGFTKNYFALFNYKILPAMFVWLWMFIILWLPISVILAQWIGLHFIEANTNLSLISLGIHTMLWVIPTMKCKLPYTTILLYPIINALASFIGFRSIVKTMKSKAHWKGRALVPPKIKWL